MKIGAVNTIFGKIGRWQIRHRVIILAVTIICTVLACLGVNKLKMSSNEEDWFSDYEKLKIDTDRFKDLFGSDDSFTVLVRAKNVFDPNVLNAIQVLSERLEAEVPYADKVTSLTTNLQIPRSTEEGFEMLNPFEDGIPEDAAELEAAKNLILSRESIVNNIVSEDCTETWIVLSLLPYEGGIEFGVEQIAPYARYVLYDVAHPGELVPELQPDSDAEGYDALSEAQKKILSSSKVAKGIFGNGYEFMPSGLSYTEMEEDEATGKECAVRIAIGFAIMLCCLIFFVRSLRGVIVPAVATMGGIGAVLGIQGHLGIEADNTMIALPILLGMALSVGYSIHYINAFRLHFRRTGLRKESVIRAVEDTGWPILFTVITTAASLVSFLFAGIGPIRWIGGCSAGIVFAVYLYVIIFIPILMSFGKDGKANPRFEASKGATGADILFGRLGGFVVKHSGIVAIISTLIMLLQVPGMLRMYVNMDYTETMGRKIPYVARLLDMLDGSLGSLYDFNVLIEFDEDDALKIPANLKRIETLEESLGSLSLTKVSSGKPRVTSITQMVKEMNRTLNDDDASFYRIPDEQDMLTQILFLYEISDQDGLFGWIDEDYRTAYVHVDIAYYDAKLITDDIARINTLLSELFPNAKGTVIGEVVNYAAMNGKLVIGELKSFCGSFIIIAIMMIIAFAGVRIGLIGMIPNIAPVLLIGGVMGYFKMPLDMVTMTVMPMILGIAVDDTIHMTNHIKLKLEEGLGYGEAIAVSFREIGKTMCMTTIILCAMFFVFVFSPMKALSRIGLLSIVGLGSALLADYTLTPALLYLLKPFGKKNKAK